MSGVALLVSGLVVGTTFGVLLWAALSARARDEAERAAFNRGYLIGYGRGRRERNVRPPVPHPLLQGHEDTELGRIAEA